jgi:deoxycytidylate deaminase
MNKKQYYITKAREMALKSPMDSRYGAILLYRGKIISYGYNDYCHKIRCLNELCQKKYERFKYSKHAEIACITKCENKKIIQDSTLMLIRINKTGDIIDCEPCELCKKYIKKYNIKRVYLITK